MPSTVEPRFTCLVKATSSKPMPLVFGRTASGLMVPVLVSATGELVVDSLPAGSALIGDVQARNLGWVSATWQKDPMRFGYSGQVVEAVVDNNLDAGDNTVLSTSVPAGEVHVITNIGITYAGTVAGVALAVLMNLSGVASRLFGQAPPVSVQLYDRQGWWVLAPGSYIYLAI